MPRTIKMFKNMGTFVPKKMLFPSLLNHVLCTSLRVRAVELVTGETNRHFHTRVYLINIFVGQKFPCF